jgi:hypothetical protein
MYSFSNRVKLLALCLLVIATPALGEFVHPGALVSSEEIATARARIAAGDSPWTEALAHLRNHQSGGLDFNPGPVANVYQGPYGDPDIGGWRIMLDARAAYLHALIWVMTDEQAHADKSIQILNAWSAELESIDGGNKELIGGGALSGFANAAELMKHTNTGWSPADQAQCEAMFYNVFDPLLENFKPGYNGNWDAIITNGMMAMGVFLDDQVIFDRAVNYFMNGHGNGSLPNYVRPDGTTQETYRDTEHENMGISGLTGSCQVAMHQGIDLYGYLDNRLLIGAEGVAERVLIDWQRPGPCWEMLYTHYHRRLGLPMPNTESLFERWDSMRPEDYGLMQGIGFGTLTAFLEPVSTQAMSLSELKRLFGGE